MKCIEKIDNYIHRITLPYKDIFTTVYIIETQDGIVLFDTGSSNEDIERFVIPFMKSIGVYETDLNYVFISHNHEDHVGGLHKIIDECPNICIITKDAFLRDKYKESNNVLISDDYDIVCGVLKIVPIPGHTKDCCALFDIRTSTLICGDCLQFYGVFGSGVWGTNICLPIDYTESIRYLKKLNIDTILTAHDYHPHGRDYIGKEAVCKAFDVCIEALDEIKELIEKNINSDFDEICRLYSGTNKPAIGKHVVAALKNINMLTGSQLYKVGN